MNTTERICGCCGKRLDGIPTDMAYRRPLHYFRVPEVERAKRIYETDDFCVVDARVFLIRGILRIALVDQPGRAFAWGLWAAVAKEHFERYLELYEVDAGDEPSFRGSLDVSPPIYPDLLGAEVAVRLRRANERPEFHPTSFEHPLFREHRDGISTARWHQIIAEIDAYQARTRH